MLQRKRGATDPDRPLGGMCFVFTGEMEMEREGARLSVIMLGGRVVTSPTGRTTHVVVGRNPGPSKMSKAKELRVQILDESGFKCLLDKHTGPRSDAIHLQHVDTDTRGSDTRRDCGLWCEKWRPKGPAELVGNQGVYTQLKGFLQGKTKFAGAVVSGPPGIGKTTMVHLAARELGLDVIEFNASDTRSKNDLLEKVRGRLNFHSVSKNMKLDKKVLVMDEIDGMTSDRGGLSELVGIIKASKIPVVCICNDRYHPKIRSMAYSCMDLRFRRPETRQVLPRIKTVLQEEGFSLPETLLGEVVQTSGGDIRYILNTLQAVVRGKEMRYGSVLDLARKTAMRGIFDLTSIVFQRKKAADKIEAYFEDYSLLPLMVQENYLKQDLGHISAACAAAFSISVADVIEASIRGPNQLWSLAPVHAFFSIAAPTCGRGLAGKIDFQTHLGRASQLQKHRRQLRDIRRHAFKCVRTGTTETRMYYVDLVFRQYASMLACGRIDDAVSVLVNYYLLKEDIDAMGELVFGGADVLKGIDTSKKAALTRAYKKLERNLPYRVDRDPREKDELGNDAPDEHP